MAPHNFFVHGIHVNTRSTLGCVFQIFQGKVTREAKLLWIIV